MSVHPAQLLGKSCRIILLTLCLHSCLCAASCQGLWLHDCLRAAHHNSRRALLQKVRTAGGSCMHCSSLKQQQQHRLDAFCSVGWCAVAEQTPHARCLLRHPHSVACFLCSCSSQQCSTAALVLLLLQLSADLPGAAAADVCAGAKCCSMMQHPR